MKFWEKDANFIREEIFNRSKAPRLDLNNCKAIYFDNASVTSAKEFRVNYVRKTEKEYLVTPTIIDLTWQELIQ